MCHQILVLIYRDGTYHGCINLPSVRTSHYARQVLSHLGPGYEFKIAEAGGNTREIAHAA